MEWQLGPDLSNGIFIRYKAGMATASELSRIFAHALGLPEVQVATRYRALREAGLTAKAARGRHTPDRSPLEAARLLIAIMGAATAADVEATTRLIGQLRCTCFQGPDMRRPIFMGSPLEAVMAFNFIDLQDTEVDGNKFLGSAADGLSFKISQRSLTAVVMGPALTATFDVVDTEPVGLPNPSLSYAATVERLLAEKARGGMEIDTRVGWEQLSAIAPALAGRRHWTEAMEKHISLVTRAVEDKQV